MDTTVGTVPGTIHTGLTTVGQARSVFIMAMRGTTDGGVITITGTARTMDGILTMETGSDITAEVIGIIGEIRGRS